MGVLGHRSRWQRGWMAGIVGVLILLIVAGCDVGTTRPVAVATATPTTTQPAAVATATLTPTAELIYYESSLLTVTSGWDTDQNCFFSTDGFHVKPNVACKSPVQNLSAVDVTVWMKPTGFNGAASDENGIEVRRTGNPASLYEFGIAANSAWSFKVCLGGFDHCTILTSGRNAVIHGMLGDVNELEVRAVGSHFALLVNGTQVGQADDASLAYGDIWLATEGTSECAFTFFEVKRP